MRVALALRDTAARHERHLARELAQVADVSAGDQRVELAAEVVVRHAIDP